MLFEIGTHRHVACEVGWGGEGCESKMEETFITSLSKMIESSDSMASGKALSRDARYYRHALQTRVCGFQCSWQGNRACAAKNRGRPRFAGDSLGLASISVNS